MSCFKNSNFICNISSRCNSDSAYLCSQSVTYIVTVKVRSYNNLVFIRTQQNLLEHRIGNSVFNQDFACWKFTIVVIVQFSFCNCNITEFIFSNLVSPFFKCTFGKFHNISLVNKSYDSTFIVNCILNSFANDVFTSFRRNRFDTDSGSVSNFTPHFCV